MARRQQADSAEETAVLDGAAAEIGRVDGEEGEADGEERPAAPLDIDPAAAAGILIERKVRYEAPSKEAAADYFDLLADQLADLHAGEASGKGAKTKAFGQGRAAGYRDAAEFLRKVTFTG